MALSPCRSSFPCRRRTKVISPWYPIVTIAIFQRIICVLDVGDIPGPILICHLSDINSNVGFARGDVLNFKGAYNLSNSLGLSRVQLRTCTPFLGLCLTTRWLLGTLSRRRLTALKNLCMTCPTCFLIRLALPIENPCLVTSLCSPELLARIGYRTPERRSGLLQKYFLGDTVVHPFFLS